MVYANQAPISAVDLTADNGVVHVLDAVVLPNQTVADVAIGSAAHTSLVAAVVEARLLPALTDPFASLTVFAPTDAAFDALATDLGTDLNGVLANPELADILLYHVIGAEVLSTDLTNGNVATLNGQDVTVDLTAGVMINDANVTAADLTSDNGVVHVLDKVLVPSLASIVDNEIKDVTIFPNPAVDKIKLNGVNGSYTVTDLFGKTVLEGVSNGQFIDVNNLSEGTYIITVQDSVEVYQTQFVKL
jgi:transforming growth factor-beta-induced protein